MPRTRYSKQMDGAKEWIDDFWRDGKRFSNESFQKFQTHLPQYSEQLDQFYREAKSSLGNRFANASEVIYAFREELVVVSVLASLKNGAELNFESPMELATLEAIRRGYAAIGDQASPEEISLYFQAIPEAEILNHVNHIAGITHELLVVDAINTAGNGDVASLFDETNHPVTDVLIVNSDGVTEEVQLKATDSVAYISEYLKQNPDIQVMATDEVASAMANEQVISSGISNQELRDVVEQTLGELSDQAYYSLLAGGTLSVIIGLAINLTPLLRRYFLTDDIAEREKIKAEVASTANWTTARTSAFIAALEVTGLGPVITTWIVAKTLFVVAKVYGPGLIGQVGECVSAKAKNAVYKTAWKMTSKLRMLTSS